MGRKRKEVIGLTRARRLLEGWVILERPLAELARLMTSIIEQDDPEILRTHLSRWYHGKHEPSSKYAQVIEESIKRAGVVPESLIVLSVEADGECGGATVFREREIALLIVRRRHT